MDLVRTIVRNAVRDGVYLRTFGLVLGVAVVAAIVGIVATRIDRNNEAIEKSCTLLNNVIVEASRSAGSSPQNSSTVVLVQSIIRRMTPAERTRYEQARQHEQSRGDDLIVKPADCKRLAEHPDQIRAIPVKR